MIKEIAKSYKKFSIKNGWTQRTAAENVGCSIQHINRIFNEKCLPSAVLAAKMEEVMGKPKSSGLEECMEQYPIGSYFVRTENGIKDPCTVAYLKKNGSKDYKNIIENLESDDYYKIGLTSEETYNILFYIPNYGFFLQQFFLYKITGYYTSDGCIFEPYIKEPDGAIITRKGLYEDIFLKNQYIVVKPDLSNLKEIIIEIFNIYNQRNKTNYIPCFCEEDYKNTLKKDEG